MRGFLQNLYLRKSCHRCPFAATPREADISLGDFWGYEKVDRWRDTSRGISAVLLNTPKGEKYFSAIRPALGFVREVSLKSVVRGNPVLREPCAAHENRSAFFADFAEGRATGASRPISEIIEKHLGDRKVGILSFASFTAHNYGAALAGYAMERAVEKLGYEAWTIGFVPGSMLFAATAESAFSRFRRRYLRLSGISADKTGLRDCVGGRFGRLVLGSDQTIGRYGHNDFVYYLDWAEGKKTLLAYAASFGTARPDMGRADRKYAAACLRRFDAFSMREEAGARTMRGEFGMECPVVCDPTMLLAPEEYAEIIDEAQPSGLPDGYVAHYFLGDAAGRLSGLSGKYPLVDAYRDESGGYRDVGDWLRILRDARYVVTDSFHGSVFSILFQKRFVVLPRESGGNERLRNLLDTLGLDCFHVGSAPVTEESFSTGGDCAAVQEKVEAMRSAGRVWLESALATQPNQKPKMRIGRWVKLFGALPLVKITGKNGSVRMRLFGVVPLLRIKNDSLYLFEALKVAKKGSAR